MSQSQSQVVTRSGTQKSKIQTRSMIKANQQQQQQQQQQQTRNIKPNPAILEAKKKAKLKMQQQNATKSSPVSDDIFIKDIFQNAMSSLNMVRGETGIIYDESMVEHKCIWDDNHPERPERLIRILQRCSDLKLIERCKRLSSRKATRDEILLKHSNEHYDKLESTKNQQNVDYLEELCSNYDCIYIHPRTFDLSILAVGNTIELIENVINGTIQNGMAIIRPPGHHAMKTEFNGYCFFNNVAIAAQYALDKLNLKRILIVDWDIHHGQGTQRFFYDDPRVLYFSIHRFEYGTFWPNLRESNFDYIGSGKGKGYNFNLPLNEIKVKNGDYLAIFQQILIPVACEYQPELIIISAGYDAALGCPEGEMEITPQFYPHLLNPLLSLTQGRIAVILEGGYCLESLSEGAALTLRTLLGDPCPSLIEPLNPPSDSVQESILNCIYAHRPYWKCLQIEKIYTLEELNNINPQPNLHKVLQVFKGGPPLPDKFPTRGCYPIQDSELIISLEQRLNYLKISTNLTFPATRVCYVYDEMMTEHQNMFELGHPEHPDRIKKIFQRHQEFNLLERMEQIQSRHATTDEISLVHVRSHINLIRKSVKKSDELQEIGDSFNSVYFHPKTFECATLAAGSVIQVIDHVLNGKSRSGVCIVRPPGHHAEPDMPHGFCIFNNVAIAAQYAVRDHGLKRVLIVDWDVHHGNGTQHIFESNKNVLYISLHRYDNGNFFPKSTDANYNVVGNGIGEGFNVNIPWNKKGMGDMEYFIAFQKLVMPIAYEFNPELVLVSAGFDAAIGDPLGGCKVTPEAYGYMTKWLSALANGKIVLCLEGGYNVNSISYAMTMCTKALLDDPLPMANVNTKNVAFNSCIESIQNVLSVHQKYWKCLKFNKKLPIDSSKIENDDDNEMTNLAINLIEKLNISKCTNDTGEDNNKSENMEKNTNEEEGAVGGGSNSSQPGTLKSADKQNKTLQEFLNENLEALQNEEMFAVIPLKTCPHLSELRSDECPTVIDTSSPCQDCTANIENWLCLHCYKTFCGRYVHGHMLNHFIESSHSLTLSYSDLSVWCYKCENYIDNPALYKYKNLAHLNKFGEELIWSYGNDTVLMLNN